MATSDPLSQRDIADYVDTMASELSQMCEAARLNALATLLYAAHLEARRTLGRLDEPAPREKTT
jgi:hypothetical protein